MTSSVNSNSPLSPRFFSSPKSESPKENFVENKVTSMAICTIIAPVPKNSRKAILLTSTSPVERPVHPGPRRISSSPVIRRPIPIRPGKANTPKQTSPVERPINPTPMEIKLSNKKYFEITRSRSFCFSDTEKCYEGSLKDHRGYSEGFILFSNGSTYNGECLNYIPHGSGVLKFIDGTTHEGRFEHGTPINFRSWIPTPPSSEEQSPSPIRQNIPTPSNPIAIPPRKKKLKPKPPIHKLQTV